MVDLDADWKFRESTVDATRRARLLKPISNTELLNLLRKYTSSVDFRWIKGDVEAKGHHRAQFRLSCPEVACDVFFNGISGIRAHYYRSVDEGHALTRYLVNELTAQLLADARQEIEAEGATPAKVSASLAVASAKIWIDEKVSTLDQQNVDAETLIAIEVPHWVEAARRASLAITSSKYTRPTFKEKALLGVQVPKCCGICIFGGWLSDGDAKEFLVPSKRNRARQIRVYGFS